MSSSHNAEVTEYNDDEEDGEELIHRYSPKDIGSKSKYKLLSKLGRGSFGSVYLGEVNATGKRVAIKVIEECFASNTEARRVLREISILRQCKHENIIKLIDICEPVDVKRFSDLWLIEEYGGNDLRKIILSCGTLEYWTIDHVCFIIYQLLVGLLYLKSLNIIHRDIKPSNILLSDKCKLKIIDFGLSRQIDEIKKKDLIDETSISKESPKRDIPLPLKKTVLSRQLTHHVVTRWYRAPELILLQSEYDFSIDMWSVGCILGELLSSLEDGKKVNPLFPGNSCYPLSKDGAFFDEESLANAFKKGNHQLQQIFSVIGTPAPEEIEKLENQRFKKILIELEKIKPMNFESLWKNANKDVLNLLSRMLAFDPSKRITVEEALEHDFFKEMRQKEKELKSSLDSISFPWENASRLLGEFEKSRLRRLILDEIKRKKSDSSSLIISEGEVENGSEIENEDDLNLISPTLKSKSNTRTKSAKSCIIS